MAQLSHSWAVAEIYIWGFIACPGGFALNSNKIVFVVQNENNEIILSLTGRQKPRVIYSLDYSVVLSFRICERPTRCSDSMF